MVIRFFLIFVLFLSSPLFTIPLTISHNTYLYQLSEQTEQLTFTQDRGTVFRELHKLVDDYYFSRVNALTEIVNDVNDPRINLLVRAVVANVYWKLLEQFDLTLNQTWASSKEMVDFVLEQIPSLDVVTAPFTMQMLMKFKNHSYVRSSLLKRFAAEQDSSRRVVLAYALMFCDDYHPKNTEFWFERFEQSDSREKEVILLALALKQDVKSHIESPTHSASSQFWREVLQIKQVTEDSSTSGRNTGPVYETVSVLADGKSGLRLNALTTARPAAGSSGNQNQGGSDDKGPDFKLIGADGKIDTTRMIALLAVVMNYLYVFPYVNQSNREFSMAYGLVFIRSKGIVLAGDKTAFPFSKLLSQNHLNFRTAAALLLDMANTRMLPELGNPGHTPGQVLAFGHTMGLGSGCLELNLSSPRSLERFFAPIKH